MKSMCATDEISQTNCNKMQEFMRQCGIENGCIDCITFGQRIYNALWIDGKLGFYENDENGTMTILN